MAEAFFARLQEQIVAHRALHHPFLQRFQSERLSREQLAAFARQHYLHGRFFTRNLGAVLASTPDERARNLIILNLYDEIGEPLRLRDRLHLLLLQEGLIRPEDLGEACLALCDRPGDDLVQILIERGAVSRDGVQDLLARRTVDAEGLTHPALFHRFLRALGLDIEALGGAEPLPETAAMIAEYHRLCRQGSWLEAMGAMGPGTECVVPTMYSYIERGLERSGLLGARDYLFWTVHIQCDDGHGVNLLTAVRPYVGTAEGQAHVAAGALRALDARAAWYDGLARLLFGRTAGTPGWPPGPWASTAGSRPLRISRPPRQREDAHG